MRQDVITELVRDDKELLSGIRILGHVLNVVTVLAEDVHQVADDLLVLLCHLGEIVIIIETKACEDLVNVARDLSHKWHLDLSRRL